jgi:DNA-binding response OmpR family regulator
MPLVNGRECLQRLRQSEKYSKVPIIIYTTSNGKLESMELLRLGASYYLTKPHRYAEMVESIRFILSEGWKSRP